MNKAYLAALVALIGVVSAQTNTTNSTNTTWTSVPITTDSHKYTLDYQISGNNVKFSLSIAAINTGSWVANKSGIYMGLGYGGTTMKNVDATVCMFTYTNKTSDAFMCMDSSFDANRVPA